jgi:hypothetical protein
MELDSTEAILSCIEAGLGVGFVSEWALVRRGDGHRLSILRLSEGKIGRTFSLVSAQGPELQPSAIAMQRFLLERMPPKPSQRLAVPVESKLQAYLQRVANDKQLVLTVLLRSVASAEKRDPPGP